MTEALTVIDFETTGLDTDTARALELGVVRFEDRKEVASASYVIRPDGDARPLEQVLDPAALAINGLTIEDIANGCSFAQAWSAVADLFAGAHPVAYNAPYDRRVLQNEVRRVAKWQTERVLAARHVHMLGQSWLDPLVYVRVADRHRKSKKLVDAAARRGIAFSAHRAVDDARAAGLVWFRLADQLGLELAAALREQPRKRAQDAISYAARQRGSLGDGAVYSCDACDDTRWSAGQPPAGWRIYGGVRFAGEATVACSQGCFAQLGWWFSALADQ